MATLDDLINSGYANMIRSPEQMAARKQEVVDATLPEYLRKYGTTTQDQLESAFGRGMGLSTWNAQQMALRQLMESEGAANIENQAQTQIEQAQRAAIADAAAYRNAGANRAQAAANAQTQATVARQLSKARGSQANQAQLVQGLTGLGAGVGGLTLRALMAKPGSEGSPQSIWANAKGNLGFGPDQAPSPQAPPALDLPETGIGAGDTYIPPLDLRSSYESTNFDTPSFGDMNFDTPAYTTSDYGSWGYSLDDLLKSLGSGGY